MKRIDVLPDDILLEIFDFCRCVETPWPGGKRRAENWQLLFHVCRRWRNLILGSPRGLNLQLFCTPETPAKDTLDIWPALPLIVTGDMDLSTGTDNIIAALGRSKHVYYVDLLNIAGWQLEQVLGAMQVPFPELTDLHLSSNGEAGEAQPVIPDSFLDGSTPRLRSFFLDGIPFPGLPNLLMSATHLVSLWLPNIPHSGYISPEAIVALISVLPSLEVFSLQFQSPQSCPDQRIRRPPPSRRSIVPALTSLHFKGVTEYLEDLVIAIDTPQLDEMYITFFNQIDFDTPRLAHFINRTPKPTKNDAHVQFDDDFARVGLPGSRALDIAILCREPDWQISSIDQVCNSSLHPLSAVRDLYIEHRYRQLVWKDDAVESTLWLDLLLPFTAVENLYLSEEFARGIAAALKELVGGRITEVLPSLHNIFVEGLEPSGPFQEIIGQFIAARRFTDHTITISDWDKYGDVVAINEEWKQVRGFDL